MAGKKERRIKLMIHIKAEDAWMKKKHWPHISENEGIDTNSKYKSRHKTLVQDWVKELQSYIYFKDVNKIRERKHSRKKTEHIEILISEAWKKQKRWHTNTDWVDVHDCCYIDIFQREKQEKTKTKTEQNKNRTKQNRTKQNKGENV